MTRTPHVASSITLIKAAHLVPCSSVSQQVLRRNALQEPHGGIAAAIGIVIAVGAVILIPVVIVLARTHSLAHARSLTRALTHTQMTT